MQAVILCGGLGTRLREETEFRPKPMVNIGVRPILWHIMRIYAHYGITEFILCLGYKGEMIKNYFVNYEIFNNDITIELGKPDQLCIHQSHNEAGWKITLADTGEKALKGARLKKIEKYITGDTFLVTYGDGVANMDISATIEFHKKHGKKATLTAINPATRFGELKLNGDVVESFSEKPVDSKDNYINGGFMVFNRAVFDSLTDADDCDIEYGFFEQLVEKKELMVYRHHGFWACMDTSRDVEYLNRLWAEGKADWKVW